MQKLSEDIPRGSRSKQQSTLKMNFQTASMQLEQEARAGG